jgi:hypothetical protein
MLHVADIPCSSDKDDAFGALVATKTNLARSKGRFDQVREREGIDQTRDGDQSRQKVEGIFENWFGS